MPAVRRILATDSLESGFRVSHNETVDAIIDTSNISATPGGVVSFYNDEGVLLGTVDLGGIFKLKNEMAPGAGLPVESGSATETTEGLVRYATFDEALELISEFTVVSPAILGAVILETQKTLLNLIQAASTADLISSLTVLLTAAQGNDTIKALMCNLTAGCGGGSTQTAFIFPTHRVLREIIQTAPARSITPTVVPEPPTGNSESPTITVSAMYVSTAVNGAPVPQTAPPIAGAQGTSNSSGLPVTSYFIDPDGDTMTYLPMQFSTDGGSTWGSLPSWITFNTANGDFNTTNEPAPPTVPYKLRLRAQDTAGNIGHLPFTYNIQLAP